MIVVSDSSPLRYLILLDATAVLPDLFGDVLIPPRVRSELQRTRTPEPVRRWMASPPTWLTVHAPTAVDPTLEVGRGEAEAISLATEVGAERLLLDDRKAREAARARGLAIVGTITVLEMGAERGLLSLPQTLERLRLTNFRASRSSLKPRSSATA